MANEFIARKGLIVLANGAKITGSLGVQGNIDATGYSVSASAYSGSFYGDGSNLTGITATGLDIDSFGVDLTAITVGGDDKLILSDGDTEGRINVSQLSIPLAGTGLEANSGTIRIATAAAGNGLTGGGGSALAVNTSSAHFISGSITSLNGTGVISSSTQFTSLTAPFTGSFTGSFTGDGSNLTGIASTLTFSGSTGNDTLNLKTEALNILGSNGITTTVTDNTVTINLPVGTVTASGQIDHNTTFNYSANQHVDHSTVSISAGSGLSGGGDITTSRTLGLDTSSAHFTDGVKSKLNTEGVISSSAQVDVRNTTGIETLATTGSNTFTGIQTINDTTNSTTYADGALVIEGGVGIEKDVNISGSLTVLGLLTVATMSTQYVTSSQYIIGTSRVIVNDDDLVRFAGLSVVDSGSSSATGSLLWDSFKNHWIYEREDGGEYRSAVMIAGPKNYGALGDEEELVVGRIPVATGGDHIDTNAASSSIYIDFTDKKTYVEAGLYVTGSVSSSAGFSGSFYGDGSNLSGIATDLQQITDNGATTSNQVTLNGGAVIHGVLYTSGSNLDVDTGTEVITTLPSASYDAAYFDYVVKKETNYRAGTVMAVWDNAGNVEFTDTSTNDIGNTSEVVMSVDTLDADIRLKTTVSTNDWIVKTAIRAL